MLLYKTKTKKTHFNFGLNIIPESLDCVFLDILNCIPTETILPFTLARESLIIMENAVPEFHYFIISRKKN